MSLDPQAVAPTIDDEELRDAELDRASAAGHSVSCSCSYSCYCGPKDE
jgi:hypothetical protein